MLTTVAVTLIMSFKNAGSADFTPGHKTRSETTASALS